MTQEEIRKCKELVHELNALVEKYYNEYLKNPNERYCNWEWSSDESNEIIIVYLFLDYNDVWDYDKTYITFEELSNFKPNYY